MKAAVCARYGPPEVVVISEVDKPAAGPGEVLVKVHATTVNRTDCSYRAPRPFFVRFFAGFTKPKRPVLGTEFAGEVEAVGKDVGSFAAGDRVFGYVEGRFGAHAEYLTVAESGWIATIPDGLTYEQAAAGTEGSHYAMSIIIRTGVRAGQDVMVYGATGAIGSAAVQLLKAMGARVTAVCATAHVELVRGLGADRIVDYTAEDFTRDEQRYDLVVDAVGKSTFGRCRRLLKPGGIYVSTDLGPGWQNLLLALVTPLFRGRKLVFPLPVEDVAVLAKLREHLASGAFRPVLDRRYPLEDIVGAYRYVESGQKVGNVVITVVITVGPPASPGPVGGGG